MKSVLVVLGLLLSVKTVFAGCGVNKIPVLVCRNGVCRVVCKPIFKSFFPDSASKEVKKLNIKFK